MAFSWLPDAARDPHPRLTWLAQYGFELVVVVLYKREAVLPPDFRIADGSVIVSNHLRNSDVPILASVLCPREGLRYQSPLPFFAARDDVFRRRFLRDFLRGAAWPRPLSALVGRVPVRWLLRLLRAKPMRRVREFTLDHALWALRQSGHGDRPPEQLLRAATLRRIEARCGRIPPTVSALARSRRLGPMRWETWGLRRLRLATVRLLSASFRATVESHLRSLVNLLEAGHSVYFAPEGVISPTGGMSRIRQGTARLYLLARRPPPIRPLAVSYDPMRRGRLRAVVRAGPALTRLDPDDMRGFNAALYHAIVSLYTLTPSHLVAWFVATGPETFTDAQCANWCEHAARAIGDAGLALDPLLARAAAAKLVRTRLAWLARRRFLRRSGGLWVNLWAAAETRPPRRAARVVRHLVAGFDEVMSLNPELAARIQP